MGRSGLLLSIQPIELQSSRLIAAPTSGDVLLGTTIRVSASHRRGSGLRRGRRGSPPRTSRPQRRGSHHHDSRLVPPLSAGKLENAGETGGPSVFFLGTTIRVSAWIEVID